LIGPGKEVARKARGLVGDTFTNLRVARNRA